MKMEVIRSENSLNTIPQQKSPYPVDWQERLSQRGILKPALEAEWQGGYQEWRYPIKTLDGQTLGYRIKSYAPHARMKYRWHPAKPDNCDYYYASPHLENAIAQSGGQLFIAGGEIDALTYVAAGIHNVLSWFGEANVPRQLGEHLQALGVREVIYLPDKDDTGMKSAVKVRDRLQGTSISYSARQLPDELPAKADTNDLWCTLGFDAQAFLHAIQNAPELSLPAPHKDRLLEAFMPDYEPASAPFSLEKISAEIERHLQIHSYNQDGWSHAIPCIFKHHDHDHERPASTWNSHTHVFHCHKCGQTWLAKDVAQQLHIDWHEHVDKPRKRPKKGEKTNHKKQLQDMIYPFEPEPFEADLHVNMPYISDLHPDDLPEGGLLIQSEIGTGKTEFIKKMMAYERQKRGYEPTVLVITHRQALAENIAQRLDMTCYKHIDCVDYRFTNQLVIVYNSLWHLSEITTMLPVYDMVIIDEIEQFHDHLGGATFKAGEAQRAYTILRQLVRQAGRVIGLDAHASNISKAWLGSFCDRLTAIQNAHIPDRGKLTLHAYRESIVQKANRLADTNEGVIVLPTNSKSEAKRLETYFKKRYGKDKVMMISSDNSEQDSIQDFIQNINERITKLKIFIYSPTLGTGIDITAPVRAVCAVFKGNHLATYDLHQLLGRCRHTQETHAYVQIVEGNGEENWQIIYDKHEKNALKTGQMCAFDEAGIYAVTPIQQSMLKLLAMLEARRNRSANASLSAFVALARCYHICYHTSGDETIKQELKDIAQQVSKNEREAVLTATPIDHDTLQKHRRQGTINHEIKAGYERWVIEETVGQTINGEVYEDLHTIRQREQLRLFTDLETKNDELQQRDQQEARHHYLLHKRNHYTMRQALIRRVLKAVWGDESISNIRGNVTGEHINRHLEGFIETHRDELSTYFGWRSDQSDKAIAVLRWLLNQAGIQLESTQIMRDGKRYRVYQLNARDLEKQQHYAHTRRQHLQKKRQERGLENAYLHYKERVITQNMVKEIP